MAQVKGKRGVAIWDDHDNLVLKVDQSGKVTAYDSDANEISLTAGDISFGDEVAGSALGTVVGSIEVFDSTGTSLGHLPVYDTIT